MTDIFLTNQTCQAQTLLNSYGLDSSLYSCGCENPSILNAYTPYMVSDANSNSNKSILGTLSQPTTSRNLTHLSLTFGGDNTTALAEITKQIQESGIGMMGASTSVYAGRMGAFGKAMQEYQNALMLYRDAVKSKAPAQTIAKKNALAAFNRLQIRFRSELQTVAGRIKSSRGTPLTSAQRAINIARDSRSIAKLQVANQAQANNLVKFTKHTKLLGNGLAVIDFGSRVGNIHTTYKAGGNWEREMFVESSSFAASAGAGIFAVNAGTAVLGLVLVATPVGWVGLVVGGIAVAGVATAASIATNNQFKQRSGLWYDNIMKWLGHSGY